MEFSDNLNLFNQLVETVKQGTVTDVFDSSIFSDYLLGHKRIKYWIQTGIDKRQES